MSVNRRLGILALIACLCPSLTARAVDGVLEINQTCAEQIGCFAGDTPGFPVTITQPGSYRLTGNLDLSALPAGITGIEVDASYVTVDLGGFSIVGPATCTGFGSNLSCGPASGGLPGAGVLNASGQRAIVIRNGTIRGMSGAAISGTAVNVSAEGIRAFRNARGGILLQASSIIRDSLSAQNAGNGMDIDVGSLVVDSVSEGNLDHGLEVDGTATVENLAVRVNGQSGIDSDAAVAVRNSVSDSNGGAGYVLGARSRYGANVSNGNGAPDSCGGGICTERRRFYLTQESYIGTDSRIATACADGFHLLAHPDFIDTSIKYDIQLGATTPDGESGPPTGYDGWYSTGNVGGCWTTGGVTPHTLSFSPDLSSRMAPGFPVEEPRTSSWFLQPNWSCNEALPVWCIED